MMSSMDGERLLFVLIVGIGVFVASSFRRRPHRCPRCRELNRDQALFCAQCGTQLPER